MKGDFSRLTHDARKRYSGVLHQQGRVWLDSDWNEEVVERLAAARSHARDVIGFAGVPEPGTAFRIAENPDSSAAPDDFQIQGGPGPEGHFYLDGILCELGETTTYLRQPDLPDPPRLAFPADGSPITAVVYLETWARLITFLEDDALREVALNGPDTTTRLRNVAQVKLAVVPASETNLTCTRAAQFIPGPGSGTLTTIQPRDTQPEDPCRLPDPANFTGRENRLYRVEIHEGGDVSATPGSAAGGIARFKWSRDNASFAVRVKAVSHDRLTLTLSSLGRDQATALREGDLVEISDDWSELGPGRGHLTRLAANPDPDDLTAVLEDPLPDAYRSDRNLLLRRWDGTGLARASFSETETPEMDLGDGVHIEFGGSDLRPGDYWQFTARAADGSVQPLAAAPPAGIVRRRVPLAVVRFTGQLKSPPTSPPGFVYRMQVVRDCRIVFAPLAEPAIHVTQVLALDRHNNRAVLENDVPVHVKKLLGGIEVICDRDLGPASPPAPLSRALCFVTAEVPSTMAGGVAVAPSPAPPVYQQWVMAGEAQIAANVISWRLRERFTMARLPFEALTTQDKGILARLTIRGNFVWAAENPDCFLDGDTFGKSGGRYGTALRLPSGDRKRGGDFEMWFWLVNPLPAPGPALSYQAAGVPTLVRSEGVAELAGDIVLQGGGGTPTRLGSEVPAYDISVRVNSTITNAPVGALSDIVLLVDEPKTLNISEINKPAAGPLVNEEGGELNYNDGDVPNMFRGVITSTQHPADTVTFRNVPIDATGVSPSPRVLRITNIRVNASAIGVGPTMPNQVAAVISSAGANVLPVTNPLVVIGAVQKANTFSLVPVGGGAWTKVIVSASGGMNAALLDGPRPVKNAQTAFRMQFKEGFATAFKVKKQMFVDGSVTHDDETGFDNIGTGARDTLPRGMLLPELGKADTGTRFRAVFTDIPQGVAVFVTSREVPEPPPAGQALPPAKAVLVQAPLPDGSGGTVPITVPTGVGDETGGVPIVELPVATDGTARAVWEVVRSEPTSFEEIRFATVIALRPSPSGPYGTMKVRGCLAPVQGAGPVASGPPIPRFIDDSTAIDALQLI